MIPGIHAGKQIGQQIGIGNVFRFQAIQREEQIDVRNAGCVRCVMQMCDAVHLLFLQDLIPDIPFQIASGQNRNRCQSFCGFTGCLAFL